MVNVNRDELPKKELVRLYKRFDETLAVLGNPALSIFLDELLGKEERLTLAKRLVAILLLSEGYSEYRVSRLLKLSPTTTGNVHAKLKTGAYEHILKLLKRKKQSYLNLLETIDSVLHLGGILPHRIGLDRYRNL